ncbi:MAG TPA: von Willebrand factor type A domain-containing protein, partial [Candidatus Obscuribacterales bacterium]
MTKPNRMLKTGLMLVMSLSLGLGGCASVQRDPDIKQPPVKVEEEKTEVDVDELQAPSTGALAPGKPYPRRDAQLTRTGIAGEREPVAEPDDGTVVHNTEEYDRIYENPFLETLKNPLSTFSIDVDTASYSNVRRFIESSHQLPPADAVRIEELVNYFPYTYPAPSGEHPFSVTANLAECPWAKSHRLMRIGLRGQPVSLKQLPPQNLVFLLDVSGSMDEPNKLPLLKRSLKLLVDQMREQDHVAIVVYAGAAGLVLPPTSGARREDILAALDQLQARGS